MPYFNETRKIISYVENHVHDENTDVEKLACTVGFSITHLRDFFHRTTGIPLVKYQLMRRIMNSTFELLYSDKNILDIALDFGFENHETYTRAFRRVLEMSPTDFRRKRPNIGRFELINGIYGISLLRDKCNHLYETRINMEKEMYQDNSSTILYGVAKVGYGIYGSTPYPVCLKAVANYLGEDVAYDYITVLSGAAFRMTWNRDCWDFSNVDIYHTMTESNDIYGLAAKSLGRKFEFLERKENTTKDEFRDFIVAHLNNGYPCMALGIVGPPEAGIITGYKDKGDTLLGWSFFQDDPYFGGEVQKEENGYYITDKWWENTDTQAVMCMGEVIADKYNYVEILKNAKVIMTGRSDSSYEKGINAFEYWAKALETEDSFSSSATQEEKQEKNFCFNDAITCLRDGRGSAASFFNWVSTHVKENTQLYKDLSASFQNTFELAGETYDVLGKDISDEERIENLYKKSTRERLCTKIRLMAESEKKSLSIIQKIIG